MKEYPILFSAPMIRAILNGSKTQTRRIMHKNQPPVDAVQFIGADNKPTGEFGLCLEHKRVIDKHVICPLGYIGDQLWVREAWRVSDLFNDFAPRDLPVGVIASFEADDGDGLSGKLRPSIFMPRWASRIDLRITQVGVEKLQDISDEDALAEGIVKVYCGVTGADIYAHFGAIAVNSEAEKIMVDVNFIAETAKKAFEKLWVSINGQKSWDANPWVWGVEFERLKP